MTPSIVALIPARAGSKRVPGKNTRLLGGRPLVGWTVIAANESGIFSDVLLCTDDQALIDRSYNVSIVRRSHVSDEQLDIVWVREALERVPADAFAILRPTSPFRTAETIRRAWAQFKAQQPCDSLRAVEPVKQHPLKMWQSGYRYGEMRPLMSEWPWPDAVSERDGFIPFHSRPTQSLPPCYVQNASLEIAWVKTVTNRRSISGDRIMPFLTEGYEGFDINTEDDWQRAASLVRDGLVDRPAVATQAPATPAL